MTRTIRFALAAALLVAAPAVAAEPSKESSAPSVACGNAVFQAMQQWNVKNPIIGLLTGVSPVSYMTSYTRAIKEAAAATEACSAKDRATFAERADDLMDEAVKLDAELRAGIEAQNR
jgi:ABC-type sugar transport system substrate-binding protein